MRAQMIAVLFLLSTTQLASDGTPPREQFEPVVYSHDPCVLTRTPELVCRRFLIVRYDDYRAHKLRIVLTAEQRALAEEWWERPENRWRRLR